MCVCVVLVMPVVIVVRVGVVLVMRVVSVVRVVSLMRVMRVFCFYAFFVMVHTAPIGKGIAAPQIMG